MGRRAMDVCGPGLVFLLLAGPVAPGVGVGAASSGDSVATTASRARASSALALPRVRVRTPEGSYVLRRPRFVTEGVAWLEAEGFPRGPRPLIASAEWDTTPPPPNPVPWDRIERLERPVAGGHTALAVGGTLGALGGGAAGGFLGFGAAMSGYGSFGTMLGTAAFGAITGGLLVGIVSHALFDRPTRWEPIAPDAVRGSDAGGTRP